MRFVVLCLTTWVTAGCIVPAPTDPRESSTARTPPQPASVKLGANFGDKLILLGAKFSPARVTLTTPMAVTLVFQTRAPLGEDDNIFVHVEDAATGAQVANVDHAPTGGPTSRWLPGELHQDDFTVALPPTSSAKAVNVWVGLWNPKTDVRQAVTNPTAVRTDGHDRVLVGAFPAAGI